MICGNCNRPLGDTLKLAPQLVKQVSCPHCGTEWRVEVIKTKVGDLECDLEWNKGKTLSHAWGRLE